MIGKDPASIVLGHCPPTCSVVECLTLDRGATDKNINPSLVLVKPRKTRPFVTERWLMGRKESNQTETKNYWPTSKMLFKWHFADGTTVACFYLGTGESWCPNV